MLDIIITAVTCLGAGGAFGALAASGSVSPLRRDLAQAKVDIQMLETLRADDVEQRAREEGVYRKRIERLRGDNAALAAQVEELGPLAETGRRVRDQRVKQDAARKAARHARGLKRQVAA